MNVYISKQTSSYYAKLSNGREGFTAFPANGNISLNSFKNYNTLSINDISDNTYKFCLNESFIFMSRI